MATATATKPEPAATEQPKSVIAAAAETVEAIPVKVRGITPELVAFADRVRNEFKTHRVPVTDDTKREVATLRRHLDGLGVKLRTRVVDDFLYFWVPKPEAKSETKS